MTVMQMINELSKLPLMAEVFIYADHGQNIEDATSVKLFEDGDDEVDGPMVVIYGL